jgi:hypothetical protein
MHFKNGLLRAALGASVLMMAANEGGDGGGTSAAAPPADPPATDPPATTPAPAPAKGTKVRVLVDCPHGKTNDVVTLSGAELKTALSHGHVDDDKGAVAYAATLPQNQPKPKG